MTRQEFDRQLAIHWSRYTQMFGPDEYVEREWKEFGEWRSRFGGPIACSLQLLQRNRYDVLTD